MTLPDFEVLLVQFVPVHLPIERPRIEPAPSSRLGDPSRAPGEDLLEVAFLEDARRVVEVERREIREDRVRCRSALFR